MLNIISISNTHTTHTQPFYSSLDLSRTTRVSWYQKVHSPTHTYPDHHPSFISFLHLLWSIAYSLCLKTSLQVLFSLPLGLEPSASYYSNRIARNSQLQQHTMDWHMDTDACTVCNDQDKSTNSKINHWQI